MYKNNIFGDNPEFAATTLSSIGDGVVITDIDKNILYLNPALEEILEVKEKDIIKKDFDEVFRFYNIDTKEYLECPAIKTLKLGLNTGLKENTVIITKNKNQKFVSATCSPVRDGGNEIIGAIVILRDITNLKKKEFGIIKSRDYSINILDQIPALIWKTNIYTDNYYFNKTWDEFTDIKTEEFTKEDWKNIIHPKDMKQYNEIKNIIVRESRKKFQKEIRLKKNGDNYRWCLIVGSPYNDLDGNYSGYIGSIYDIHDRKVTEDDLKRYKKIIDNARDIILITDIEGNIIEANNAAVYAYGYSNEELCGMSVNDLREDSKDVKRQLDQANKIGIFFETVHKKKDGTSIIVEVTAQGIDVEESRIIFSIIRDITKDKEIEEKLVEAKNLAEYANKAKSQFLANMSHEIRTPINGMLGMIDLTLLTDIKQDQEDNLIIAKKCANSLLKIINDILDFSKMEAGKLTTEDISFNIKELIEETVKTKSLEISKKGLELNYTYSSTIPDFLIGDPNRLQQVLNNLISNAIKFTEEGSIDVIVKNMGISGNYIDLQFTVADTGIGISQEDQKKIFESFSQVENSYTKNYQGSGLGLAISKNIVEIMGGTLGVESEIEKGSKFYFLLRFKIGHETGNELGFLPNPTLTYNKLKILLVEDDSINQRVIYKMLSQKGHSVEIAGNGQEGLDLYRQNKYDLVLMDIQMPVMNGVEVVKKIRELEDSESLKSKTPIIAMTAYALLGDKEMFINEGFDGYLSKPIQINDLFKLLDEIPKSNTDTVDTTD
ncbi:MAG: PAS domain S-box protein [Epulopiscium sp.]|nr:PAS domain S-box protein [Candidatus Epulonipiscium sp.]